MYTNATGQSWLDQNEYPFKHHYIELESGTMHYVDEGSGDILLFVHGTPTWSFLYRHLISELSAKYRTIAIDHLGFGLSAKPETFRGRPEDHARNLSEFIQRLELDNITLVIHDFGGPIGLAAGIEHAERIKQVVMFNTWLWETASNKAAQKINRIINSPIGRFLYLRLNFSPRVLLKKAFSDKKVLSKTIHKQYYKPYPDKPSRIQLYRIAQSLVGSSDWYEQQWQKLDLLENKPWLILWGIKDNLFSRDFLKKWKRRLPHARVHTYNAGHFVQEEYPNKTAAAISSFLSGSRAIQYPDPA